MRNGACVALLAWALPRLGLRWEGYRRVRRQVCKRIGRRMRALALSGPAAYRARLEAEPGEWLTLDRLCFITISRFYRDRAVFDFLRDRLLPDLGRRARAEERAAVRAWCAGAANGEEPYSLRLAWDLAVAARVPGLDFEVVATDADDGLLVRARQGLYAAGSLKELPPTWHARAFAREDHRFRLDPRFRAGVSFLCQDLREEAPAGPFDLVLCRNLAFTYFAEAGQRAALARIAAVLHPGGALVVGQRERLPAESGFRPLVPGLGIFGPAPAGAAPG
ncbi:MAG: methyltransferase domain-containing protein [Proteobacteria bacterium]|nr:methyltransferase domain-containing protein [Pseudomonadota bacterium]